MFLLSTVVYNLFFQQSYNFNKTANLLNVLIEYYIFS